jgi:flagellar motility protein MotE (MotC chaperone)
LQDVRQKASALDSVYTHERKYNKQLEQDVLDLNARIDILLKSEQKLKKWEARREVINHYMSVVSDMSK